MKRHSLAKAILYVVGLGLLVAAGDLFGQGNVPRTYDTVAQLTNSSTAFASGVQLSALVRGTSGPAGGVFYWASTATNAVDNTNYFPATTSGRWVRVTYWTLDTVDDTYTNFWSDLTNYVAAGTNILLTVGTNKLLINSLASGGTATVNGTTVVTNFYNAGYHSFNDAGGGNINIDHPDGSITRAKLENFPAASVLGNSSGSSGPSEYLTAGANITISGGQISASVLGGGATNGTPVSVNSGSLMTWANLINSAAITFTISSSTNIYGSIVDSSITTNKIDSTFWNWIDGKTSIANLNDLSDVNIGTPSTGQLLMYTNSIWTNLTVSLGGGTTYTGTNGVTVSGSVISGFYYPSNNIAFTTNANGSISISAVVSTNTGTVAYVDSAGPQTVLNLADGGGIGFTLTGTNVTADVEANAVALATDTTGNYIATIAGTANQISVSGSGSENAAVTLSLPSTINVDTINANTLGLTNRLTTNHLTLSTSPVIIGRTLGGSGVAQELTLTGAGAVTIITNAGGIIVSNPVVTVGGGSNTLTINSSTNLPILNIRDGSNSTWTRVGGTNAEVEFTGVGSNTNGYLSRSSSYVSISNTVAETEVYAWSIPAGTLTANGDELEFVIYGRYLTYSGQTTGYAWKFSEDYQTGTETYVDGSYASAFDNSVTTFAIQWKARVRRISSTSASFVVEHTLGADISTDLTNCVKTLRYNQDHTLDSSATWDSNDVPFGLTITLGSANAGHGVLIYGYTVTKVGSVGAGGGGASVSDTAYGSGWNGDTTVAPSKNAVYDEMELRAPKASPTFTGTVTLPTVTFGGTTETNWPTMGVRLNQTKVDGVPYWNFIKVEDWLNASSGTTVESGMQLSANGGAIVSTDVAFGAPGIRRLRVDSTNDAPVASWASVSIATNTGPECWFTESRVRVRTLSVGTSEIQARIGFFNGLSQTNIPNHSAICIYDTNRVGTAWGFLTSTNGTLGTITMSSTTVTADSWVRLGVALFTDKAIGYINGVPFATNSASLPTGQTIGAGFGLSQVSGTGTANMDFQVDWTEFRYYSGQ